MNCRVGAQFGMLRLARYRTTLPLIVEYRKAPYLQRGFSYLRDRSPFSVAEAPTQGEREGVTK